MRQNCNRLGEPVQGRPSGGGFVKKADPYRGHEAHAYEKSYQCPTVEPYIFLFQHPDHLLVFLSLL